MAKFQRKPFVVHALPWHKPGDHPADVHNTPAKTPDLPPDPTPKPEAAKGKPKK